MSGAVDAEGGTLCDVAKRKWNGETKGNVAGALGTQLPCYAKGSPIQRALSGPDDEAHREVCGLERNR